MAKIDSVWFCRLGDPKILTAQFHGEGFDRGYASAGKTSLTVYSVPSASRPLVEQSLTHIVIPKLIKWIEEIDRSCETLRDSHKLFVAEWSNDTVLISMKSF
ncbi:MAG: hypothetical protein K2Y37_13155 [Pirellulales bacterium]|nr:hypothetical protein [Pirellulales bacterium]